jgi:DNA-nicking Smr family endonuclease
MSRKKKKQFEADFQVDDELDLHGFYRHEIRDILFTFIRECRADKSHVVAVVVGRGHHSNGSEGVLKSYVQTLLNEAEIHYESPPPRLGGEGVLILELA